MPTVITAIALGLLLFQSSGQGKKTDRDFDELSGPVRFVRVEVEDYGGQSIAPIIDTRILEKIVAYDLSGRVTEEIHGLGRDCVSYRHVYTYDAEGNRTHAIYPGNAKAAGGEAVPAQPHDSPLFYKQVFKIDGAGRRSEFDEYDKSGKLSGHSYYKYDDQGRLTDTIQERYGYSASPSRCEFKYNERGVASEKTCQNWTFTGREKSQYVYDYDASGNWIKRTAKISMVLTDGSVRERTEISYREFQYYPSKEDQAQPQPVAERFDATRLATCLQPKIVRKSGGVFQGSATKRVAPEYPRAAKAARIVGSVVVEVAVNEAGKVIAARALSGPDELRGAAVEAARRWKFEPTMLGGEPLKVIGTITFSFNL